MLHPFRTGAIIVDISEKGIVTDQTVAFAEAGGQDGDQGIISLAEEKLEIPFIKTKKGIGRLLLIKDFPVIHVETAVYHEVAPEFLNQFKIGMKIQIEIDTERRAHITASSARLDFKTPHKFCQDDLGFMEQFLEDFIKNDEPIRVYHHQIEKEAWYWKCRDAIYPCGGTHLPSCGYLGSFKVK